MVERSVFNTQTVDTIRTHFLSLVDQLEPMHKGISYYKEHALEVEKLAINILGKYAHADSEIVLLAVWLNDIGNLIGNKSLPLYERSGIHARTLLVNMGLPEERVEAVAHCIVAGKKENVYPKSLEAKIVSSVQSAVKTREGFASTDKRYFRD